METAIRNYLLVHNEKFDLSAEFNVAVDNVLKNYQTFLNKFNCKKHNLLDKFDMQYVLKEPTKAIAIEVYFAEVSIKIINKNPARDNKLLSTYLVAKENNKEISIEQLFWFLNNSEILNLFNLFKSGSSFIPRLDRQIYSLLEIPVAQISLTNRNKKNTDYSQFNRYIQLLNHYYSEYKNCHSKKNYFAAVTLAGSICELILFQLLIEQETVSERFINDKGLGSLIEYAKMMNLEKQYRFPINAFEEIKNVRNKIVHPNNSIKENLDNLNTFIKPEKINDWLRQVLICFGIN